MPHHTALRDFLEYYIVPLALYCIWCCIGIGIGAWGQYFISYVDGDLIEPTATCDDERPS